MYTFKTSNENIAFSTIYCDCCKHKWTATKYVNKDGKWIKTDFYKRFDTLEELKDFVENYEEAENRYYFSEDNRESLPDIMDRSFTENQLKEVYRDIIDKTGYKDFQEWFFDMLKMGLIVCVREENKMKDIIKDLIQLAEENEDYELIYQIKRLIQELALTYNAPSNWRNVASELQKEYTNDSWVYEELELWDYE